MRKVTKIRRSVRAISPVISVLLMIAIAVVASLVAYAWVMGYMDFTTTKVGKQIQIQSVSTNAVYVQNIGDSDVTITDVYVNGNLVTTGYTMTPTTGLLGPSKTAGIVFTSGFATKQATVKIVTSDGISAEHTETFSGASATFEPEEPQTIFSDGFEATSWKTEWVDSRLAEISIQDQHTGDRSAKLTGTGHDATDDDGFITLQIATTGYTTIELSYWRQFYKDTTDNFIVEWRAGTSGDWTQIEQLSSTTAWGPKTATLNGAADQSTIQIKFRLEYCEIEDYSYIDDVVITGIAP